MALASLLSRGQAGLDAYLVTVEVHLAGGLPGFAVTGLPAGAVRESKDRVRAALASSGYSVPVSRITAHLGPADIPKQGGRFDLPIALGVIMADRQARWRTGALEFLGELSLNGDLRPITGALPAVLAAQKAGRALVLPAANAGEAALVTNAEVYVASTLTEVVQHLDGSQPLPGGPIIRRLWPPAAATVSARLPNACPRTSPKSGATPNRNGSARAVTRGRLFAGATKSFDRLSNRRTVSPFT